MDLLTKTLLAAVIVVVAAFVIYYLLSSPIFHSVSMQQAEQLITADIHNTDPSAVVMIGNATPSSYKGSWTVYAYVTYNATSPCPSYYEYRYDYPKFGLNFPTIVNTYTADCAIPNHEPINITSAPVAQTWSYSYISGTNSVKDYVDEFGFGNVMVTAVLHNQYPFRGINYTKVWAVDYSSGLSSNSLCVLISQPGNFIGVSNSVC